VTRKRELKSYLMDMVGVLVREEHAIPGADAFIARLRERGFPFLVLTGLTTQADAEYEPYRASRIIESVADLIPELG
jgi:ribonucleotide monophosphatase NagD (HAD superfamily)